MEWLFFQHRATGGRTKVANLPGIREYYLARGWDEIPDPDLEPGTPPPVPEPVDETPQWVTLYHPAVQAYHDFPNNAAALAGARSAGWVDPPEPGEPTPGPGPDPEPIPEDPDIPPGDDPQEDDSAPATARTAKRKG